MEYFTDLAGNAATYKGALHAGAVAYLAIRFLFISNSVFGLLVDGKTSTTEAGKTAGVMLIAIILLIWFLIFQTM